MKSLRLFNCVLAKDTGSRNEVTSNGIFIAKDAQWAKNEILTHYKSLSSKELNQTPFYKNFEVVRSMSRFDLLIDQIIHYSSTYGTNFNGNVYIPSSVLNIPSEEKLEFKVINGVSSQELINKCLSLLKSGIALSETDVKDILAILIDELGYKITEKDVINNKEALVILADKYNIIPFNPIDTLRLAVYRSTGKSLLIKNPATILAIKNSNYNPEQLFTEFGLTKLSEIFNRYKVLFLSYKNKCADIINKLSKLSKHNHKAMIVNPVNRVTSSYKISDKDLHWFNNATPYAYFKAMNALETRVNGQKDFCYRIRNGKSWTTQNKSNSNLQFNLSKMWEIAKERWGNKFNGKKFYIPAGITYALPTSTKMYIGNVPSGTVIEKDNLVVGIYWRNSWGSRDIDLSAVSINDKVGWNSRYYTGDLTYSGDITNAPKGASEYLHCNKGRLSDPVLVMANIYHGSNNTKFKLLVGHDNNVSRDYIINPKNVIFEEYIETVQRQVVLGIMLENKICLLNFSSGDNSLSVADPVKLNALYYQTINNISLNDMIILFGGEIVGIGEECDIDLSLNKLDKDTIINLFL